MKSLPRLIVSILGSLVVIASSVAAEAPIPVIGKDSEWKTTTETIRLIHQECSEKKAPDFGKCFVDFMARAGASSKAVAFAQSTGNTGYLAHFFKKGRVDLAYVHYPFRANENEGWLLVNSDPAMIDVDSFSNLPQRQLEGNPAYLRIREKFPNVMLFGGDRTITRPPEMNVQPTKGQRFVVEYRLLNGCHACERVGRAWFAFDFDANGKFLGSTLLDVQ
ncbi:MAG: hypothetical protein ACLP5H_19865 [Desulfomonilaceae bacterium]